MSKDLILTDFLGGKHYFKDKEELHTWIDGATNALYAFAINRDGVLYVGSTGTTYKQAAMQLFDQYIDLTGDHFDKG